MEKDKKGIAINEGDCVLTELGTGFVTLIGPMPDFDELGEATFRVDLDSGEHYWPFPWAIEVIT